MLITLLNLLRRQCSIVNIVNIIFKFFCNICTIFLQVNFDHKWCILKFLLLNGFHGFNFISGSSITFYCLWLYYLMMFCLTFVSSSLDLLWKLPKVLVKTFFNWFSIISSSILLIFTFTKCFSSLIRFSIE